jgi:poly(3-hydroxybutyrate) depolymerase
MRALSLLAIATLVLAACTDADDDVATDDGPAASAAEDDGGSTTTSTSAPTEETTTAVASAGCGLETPSAPLVDERTTITSGDTERWYLVTTPTGYSGTEPLPVVVDSHGFSEGAEIHTLMSEMDDVAEANGFIAVYPNGTGEPVRWSANAGDPDNPDTAFIGDLLDTVEADLCVDTSRIYATGLSNGALLTSVLACALEDRFAAVAPVAGAMDPIGCDSSVPMPFLTIHGTLDNFLPFNGGLGSGLSLLTGEEPDPDTHGDRDDRDLEGAKRVVLAERVTNLHDHRQEDQTPEQRVEPVRNGWKRLVTARAEDGPRDVSRGQRQERGRDQVPGCCPLRLMDDDAEKNRTGGDDRRGDTDRIHDATGRRDHIHRCEDSGQEQHDAGTACRSGPGDVFDAHPVGTIVT